MGRPKKSKDAERTLSRTKHELPVKLTREELADAGVKLAGLLRDQGALDRHLKEVKAEMKSQEDVLQGKVDVAAMVIRNGEELRKVEVEIRADFQRGMVTVVRIDTGATVTTRKLSDDERQKKMVFDLEDADEAADEAIENGEVPKLSAKDIAEPTPEDLRKYWSDRDDESPRSPLPEGKP